VLKDVPLWLDEGLAEYYEVPADWKGSNYHHVNLLRHGPGGPCRPDLARLEQMSQVQQMSPAEYREAWAWVHLLLRDRPEARAVLIQYLQQMRLNPNPGLLQPRMVALFPDLQEAFGQHLAKLDSGRSPTSTVQRP